MIRHIVLLKARPEVTEDHLEAIFADLHALHLPGLLALHSGRSESPEQIERGYLHGFTVDFADWQALAAYQSHPDHQRVGRALVAAAEGGIDGILVFDLPIEDAP
ncbi:Dabb family protein [Tabrizicola sp.]|uniref:Dabb family protein n=1 Tax=Tabrizicola sp. TaxID=2005166 RepID=UPI0035B2BC36